MWVCGVSTSRGEEVIATHGADLVKILPGPHSHRHDCPECGQSIMQTAIVDLVYTFEVCTCDEVPYTHLMETIWHRRCFVPIGGTDG